MRDENDFDVAFHVFFWGNKHPSHGWRVDVDLSEEGFYNRDIRLTDRFSDLLGKQLSFICKKMEKELDMKNNTNIKELTIDGIHIQNILYDIFSISFIGYLNDRNVDSETSKSYKDFKFILKYNTYKKYFELSINYKDNLIFNTVLTSTMLQTSTFYINKIIKNMEKMTDVELYQDKED